MKFRRDSWCFFSGEVSGCVCACATYLVSVLEHMIDVLYVRLAEA